MIFILLPPCSHTCAQCVSRVSEKKETYVIHKIISSIIAQKSEGSIGLANLLIVIAWCRPLLVLDLLLVKSAVGNGTTTGQSGVAYHARP